MTRLTRNSLFKLANIALISFVLSACGSDITQAQFKRPQPPIDETKLSQQVGTGQDGTLKQHLENIRQAYNVPAITAMTIKNGLVYEIASTGYRDIKSQILVSDNDRWEIGSVAKSMTAVLAARLVEQGLITFDSTIIEVLPELKGQIRKEHESITLKHLLSMTSGLKKDINIKHERWFDTSKTMQTLRSMLAKEVLNTEAVQTRGLFEYSNVGYVIAGHMLERVSNKTWEQLINDELFAQLGIINYGFGEPTLELSDQPKGHIYRDGEWQAITAGTENISLVYGPAGTINISLPDLAVYFATVLEGMRGGDNIISRESYKMLLSPYSKTDDIQADYAMGWYVKLDKTVFLHTGATQTFSASSNLYPSENSAYFIAVNGDTYNAPKAIFEAVKLLISRNVTK